MNLPTLIVLLIVAGAVAFAAYSGFRKKKKGCCPSACGACAMRGMCHKERGTE